MKQTKDARLHMRLTRAAKKLIEKRAKHYGMSVGSYVVKYILAGEIMMEIAEKKSPKKTPLQSKGEWISFPFSLLMKKNGWNKDCSQYNCSCPEGHSSWWKSISSTPEWDLWYKHASKNILYDVDECAECGWMSLQHAQDFMKFVRSLRS